MIVLANVDGMRAALAAVSSVVPARSPKPVLQSVLLTANENDVTLTANDLEVSIVYHVSGVRVDQPGRVLLPFAKFSQIMKLVQSLDVAIELAGDKILIKTDKGKWNLLSEDPGQFPLAMPFISKNYLVCDSAELLEGIKRTEFAVDVDSTRYALGGVCFLINSHHLQLVATDGRRLALQPVTKVTPHGEIETAADVVSVKALRAIKGIIGGGSTHLYMTRNSVHVRTERATVYGRLVEGRFPRWQDVLPGHRHTVLSISAGDFLAALAQAAVTTSDESRGLQCNFMADGTVRISSKSEIGTTAVEIQAEWVTGACDTQVTFDHRFIADGLSKMIGYVELVLSGEKGPGLINGDSDYKYVVMPLTKEA